jgi:hypothetical protein
MSKLLPTYAAWVQHTEYAAMMAPVEDIMNMTKAELREHERQQLQLGEKDKKCKTRLEWEAEKAEREATDAYYREKYQRYRRVVGADLADPPKKKRSHRGSKVT